jgi:flavin reductase (DIM6/NTAB) family NADH-FMN oxidoreductase RutF
MGFSMALEAQPPLVSISFSKTSRKHRIVIRGNFAVRCWVIYQISSTYG